MKAALPAETSFCEDMLGQRVPFVVFAGGAYDILWKEAMHVLDWRHQLRLATLRSPSELDTAHW